MAKGWPGVTTLMERAKTTHRRNVITAAKQTITFRRASDEVEIEDAIGYEIVHQYAGPDNLPVHVVSMVWLLPQDQVVISGSAVKPQMNDQIEDANGDIFEPFRPSADVPDVVNHCGTELWLVNSERRVNA